MLDSPVIDTVVGLVVVFYALALLCAGLVELIANRVKKRSKYLLRGLRDLVEDGLSPDGQKVLDREELRADYRTETGMYGDALRAGVGVSGHRTESADPADHSRPELNVNAIMAHGLLLPYKQTSASGRVTRNPSYLPGSVFTQVLVDLLTPTAGDTVSMGDLRTALRGLDQQPAVREALNAFAKAAGDNVKEFTTSVERWFDTQMERVSGSYKRWAKRWVLVVATVVVLAGGIDSIAIARSLYADDAIRGTVSQTVPDELCPAGTDADVCAEKAKDFFTANGLPLGWSAPDPADGVWGIPLKILGLLLSVGAAGLGAPFWYQALNRIGSLRNTGARPASSAGTS